MRNHLSFLIFREYGRENIFDLFRNIVGRSSRSILQQTFGFILQRGQVCVLQQAFASRSTGVIHIDAFQCAFQITYDGTTAFGSGRSKVFHSVFKIPQKSQSMVGFRLGNQEMDRSLRINVGIDNI